VKPWVIASIPIAGAVLSIVIYELFVIPYLMKSIYRKGVRK